jgi:hypothetical protein
MDMKGLRDRSAETGRWLGEMEMEPVVSLRVY